MVQQLLQQELSIYGVHKMKKIEYNIETGETKEIQLTLAEIQENEAEAKRVAQANAERLAAFETKAAERAALLSKLGITAEEAQLLLGGN